MLCPAPLVVVSMLEIDSLLDTDPADLPASSRYLLEMDFTSANNLSDEQKSYWVYAMKAACRAGRRTLAKERLVGKGARSRRLAPAIQRIRRTRQSLGSAAVERQIALDFKPRQSNPRKRKSLRALEGDYPSNRRKHPD